MGGFQLVNGLAGLLILTSVLVTLVRSPAAAARSYALQSFVLVLIFIALARVTGSPELYLWSASAFVTKVVLVPLIMLRAFGRLHAGRAPSVTAVAAKAWPAAPAILLAALVVALSYGAVAGIRLPAAAELKPALAVSLAHFFLGLACIVGQRNIVKQVFGYCLMENGSHLTLALLAPNAPELVEIGVATDAIFAVIILAVLATRIRATLDTLDGGQLTMLRG